jgi:hypothetical protein
MSIHYSEGREPRARVYDVADPARLGAVIKAGPEVSEVRFDDGAERNIPNDHLRPVAKTSAGVNELDNPTHSADEQPATAAIRRGQEAWSRLRAGLTWSDWVAVGLAHVIGRTTAMRDGHVNKPNGRSYNAAFSAWQKKFGFEGLDKGDRARLFDVVDHLKEINGWLEKLPESERLRLNHPSSVWRRWKAATAAPKPDAEPKLSPYAKLEAVHMALIEKCDRMEREIARGGGDLWDVKDGPKDIARVILGKLSKRKAETVAREILKQAGGASWLSAASANSIMHVSLRGLPARSRTCSRCETSSSWQGARPASLSRSCDRCRSRSSTT